MGGNSDTVTAVMAESSVIGCLIGYAEKCNIVYRMLAVEMFLDKELAEIYKNCSEMFEENQQIDYVTVVGRMGDGYKQVIYECTQTAPYFERAVDYAEIVRENWRKREVKKQLLDISTYTDGTMVKDIVKQLEIIVEAQNDIEKAVIDGHVKSAFKAYVEMVNSLYEPDTSIKTGYSEFDRMTGGLGRQMLYVLAGRPGEGKTDFALNIAKKVSATNRVCFCSLEMTASKLIQRLVSNITGIEGTVLRDRKTTKEQRAKILSVESLFHESSDFKLIINESQTLNAADIKSMVIRYRPDLLIVDNLQVMESMKPEEKQYLELDRTTKMLRQMAVKYNLCVLLLVQEKRETAGGNPLLGGLKGSSQTEANADVVIFTRSDRSERNEITGDEAFNATMWIVKGREGPTGKIFFKWQPQYSRYLPTEKRYEEENHEERNNSKRSQYNR